jgi:hypothetical protein
MWQKRSNDLEGTVLMAGLEIKSLGSPEEVRPFVDGKEDVPFVVELRDGGPGVIG